MNSLLCEEDCLLQKINLFMNLYILHEMDPEKIFWWISLSGGKDSYTMAYSLFLWYQRYGYRFHASGFYISQWGNSNYYYLQQKVQWMPIVMVDGALVTQKFVDYCPGMQAPCAKCSAARKYIGDQYILDNYKNGFSNIIVRGLHLTDMAISFLWRSFWGINTIEFANKLEKGKPFEKLDLEKPIYLAKPLCFVREYECERFARSVHFEPVCCGCPACKYPSRRDIVEESLRLLFTGDFWEFDVTGIKTYLKRINPNNDIREFSLKGNERKCMHLTSDFADYALDYWRAQVKKISINFNNALFLDMVGRNYLTKNESINADCIYMPKFFSGEDLNAVEKMMIATVGPFWGAIGYRDKKLREQIMQIQADIFKIKIDPLWTQVNTILNEYYKWKEEGLDEKIKNNNLCFNCNCYSFGDYFCGNSNL